MLKEGRDHGDNQENVEKDLSADELQQVQTAIEQHLSELGESKKLTPSQSEVVSRIIFGSSEYFATHKNKDGHDGSVLDYYEMAKDTLTPQEIEAFEQHRHNWDIRQLGEDLEYVKDKSKMGPNFENAENSGIDPEEYFYKYEKRIIGGY